MHEKKVTKDTSARLQTTINVYAHRPAEIYISETEEEEVAEKKHTKMKKTIHTTHYLLTCKSSALGAHQSNEIISLKQTETEI